MEHEKPTAKPKTPPAWENPGPEKEEWKNENRYTPLEIDEMRKDRGFRLQKRKVPML